MSLTNCARCGKVFNSDKGQTVCADCGMAENHDMKKVVDYLRKNPLASVMEVHEKTGVSQTQIFRFINNGSFKITKSASQFKCRLCGKDISKGTVCHDCDAKIKDGLIKKQSHKKPVK